MPDRSLQSGARILPIVRRVRARWRLRVFLRGVSIVLAAGFGAFLLSAYGLEATRFNPVAVTTLRISAWAAVFLIAWWFLLRPLLRRISDEQVALYLEEHEPSLEAAIMGAVGVENRGSSSSSSASPELLRLLVERAMEKVRGVEYGRRIEKRGLIRTSASLAITALGLLAFGLVGPGHLRYGMTTLVLPTTEAAEVSPYSISVLPGDITVARGSDQLITAQLRGFDSDEVFVFSRVREGQPHQRLTMFPADSGRFELLLLNLVENTDYFVEANGVRSSEFNIEVEDLPYVERIKQTYFFPRYTGLSPREVEDGGDIAAVAGTVVALEIQSTIPTAGGRLLVGDSVVMELAAMGEGMLAGEITVRRPGVYRIDLARADGRMIAASPEYDIDVLTDLVPSVAISRPGRDASASPIEEIFVEARADDDYGVRDLRLVYSVNGEVEDTLSLFTGIGAPLTEVSAGRTFFLEEWDLEAGDLISYYAIVRDNRPGAAVEAVSDIYFIDVRPFRRDYRQAEQRPQGGGQQMGGAQGQGGTDGSLSDLQKEVVAATFNLLRDREDYTPEEFSENTVSVALAQGRVREQVSTLLQRMNSRGVSASDPHFQEIAELLPEAIRDMEASEGLLRQEEPRDALAPEQRALRALQKAEETYERQVGQQQGGGSGGGGGGSAAADDLADLFELELDKLQNQYETVQRGERQQADEQVDELMERLKELARRQQQEVERQRRRAEAQQGGAGGAGGESQRALAEDAEETARQLQELSRRTGDQSLAETARRLQEAADAMRRSAAGSGRSQGVADATSALDELDQAQRRLERTRENRAQEEVQDALERVNRLAENQEQVREGVERLSDAPGERAEGIRRLQERKDEMLRETFELERDLVQMQQSAYGENREAAEELEQAARAISEGKLKEKLAYSKGVVEQRDRETALRWEEEIAGDIEALRREVAEAAQAFEEGVPDREMEDALDQARDLVRGTESLERRLQGQSEPGEGTGGPGGEQAGEGRGQTGERGQQAGGRGGQRGGEQGDARRQDPGASGGATRGDPQPFTEEEIRQYTREFAERLEQAQGLRRALEETGRDVGDLDEAIRAMEELREPGTYGDLPQIAILQQQIRENLKRLEFVLRREVEGDARGRAALSGSDEVPEGFRRMVEEYFRSLARRSGGGGGGR